jgi:hypothetical protein
MNHMNAIQTRSSSTLAEWFAHLVVAILTSCVITLTFAYPAPIIILVVFMAYGWLDGFDGGHFPIAWTCMLMSMATWFVTVIYAWGFHPGYIPTFMRDAQHAVDLDYVAKSIVTMLLGVAFAFIASSASNRIAGNPNANW